MGAIEQTYQQAYACSRKYAVNGVVLAKRKGMQ